MSERQKSAPEARAERNTRLDRKVIVVIIIAVAALAFVFSNVAPATLRFLFLQFTMPAWGWFLAVLVAGFVIGSCFPWFRTRTK